MPSWLPGDDYMTNFKVGDPYVRIDDGYARLPGAGYEALHPELKGVDPEDYPDIHKLRILSDVAPYSREYNTYRQHVAAQAHDDTGLQIELDKIVDRVRQVKESSILMDNRRFTAPVDEIEGTVESASPAGVTLKEYPGWMFRFSSVGTSAADLSARVLGENNNQVSPSCRPTKTSRTRGPGTRPFSAGRSRQCRAFVMLLFAWGCTAALPCCRTGEGLRDRAAWSGSPAGTTQACCLARSPSGPNLLFFNSKVVIFGAAGGKRFPDLENRSRCSEPFYVD
jgi:hypothetical protein